MIIGQLINFIERSINEEKLTEDSPVYIGTKKYQTQASSYSNNCGELTICEYSEEEDSSEHTFKDLKVYSVGDCEYWVTDTLENLLRTYEEETGEEINQDELEECDIDKDGMFWNFDDIPEMAILIKLLMIQAKDNNSIKLELDGKEYYFAHRDGYGMHISFLRAIELDGEFVKPHLIASTEC